MSNRLLRACEVAELLGLDKATVYRMLSRRELPQIHFGAAVRVPAEQLDQWIEANTEMPRDDAEGEGYGVIPMRRIAT